MNREAFGPDFKWGVSTAAYQVEGAYNTDGKGPSIWDKFSNTRGNIVGGHTGNQACDFYHRFAGDLQLLKFLNIPEFRFSLSWSRILPEGSGQLNPQGMDFYDRLIDNCLEMNITPWLTLYHWDLPQALEDRGGWTNREVVQRFADYTALCASRLGDRVKNWMVLNEPMVFTGAGYFLGVHAPGRKGLKNFIPAVHHAALCQAEGGRILRELVPHAQIGSTFSCSDLSPFSDTEKDLRATQKVDALLNRLFIEPALGMGYPVKDLPLLERLYTFFLPGDEQKLAFDFDFTGIQNYTREVVKHSWMVPLIKAKIIKADKRKVPCTLMNWEVYPASIYNIIKKYDRYPGIRRIIITENGAAFRDEVLNGQVMDTQRTDFLSQHIAQVLKAKQEGAKVSGYFIWTFTDNFEWAEGFHPRFGLVHVNFETQQRIIKQSGYWYKQFLQF